MHQGEIVIPEIVEVQVQVDGLQEVIGETIESIVVYPNADVLLNYHPTTFCETLEGARINNIFRIGKYIIMELQYPKKLSKQHEYLYLLTHLGMSGAYLINNEHRHARISFYLSNNRLYYKDMRYFGNLKIFTSEELQSYIKSRKLGVDALTSTRYEIEFSLVKKLYDIKYLDKPIKKLLLDQTIISGLGNIYVCETLFMSGIHPEKTPAEIGFNDIRNMAEYIETILGLSYEVGGSSIKDFASVGGKEGKFSEYMKVYGRKGKKCFNCDNIIEVVKIDNRSSFYCPNCQRR